MSERRVTSMGVGILNAAIVERDSGGTKGECGFLRCTAEDRSCENLEIRGGIAKKVEALIAKFQVALARQFIHERSKSNVVEGPRLTARVLPETRLLVGRTNRSSERGAPL